MKLAGRRRSWAMVTGVAVASLALTACSAGSLGSSSGGGGTTITFLVDNSDTGVAQGNALADGFHAKNLFKKLLFGERGFSGFVSRGTSPPAHRRPAG